MLSIPQAATHSGRGAETIRRWIRSGRLPAHRTGGRLYVHQEELDALIARPAHDLPAGWSRTSWGTPQLADVTKGSDPLVTSPRLFQGLGIVFAVMSLKGLTPL